MTCVNTGGGNIIEGDYYQIDEFFTGNYLREAEYQKEIVELKQFIQEAFSEDAKSDALLKDDLEALDKKVEFLDSLIQLSIANAVRVDRTPGGGKAFEIKPVEKETIENVKKDINSNVEKIKNGDLGPANIIVERNEAKKEWKKLSENWQDIFAYSLTNTGASGATLTSNDIHELRYKKTTFAYNKGNLSSFEGVWFMKKIKEINVNNNRNIQSSHFNTISYLTGLKVLDVTNTGVTDLSFVHNFPNLEELDISKNKTINDLTPLRACPKLKDLDCQDNKITTISPLAELKLLEDLEISDNNLTDLVGVEHLSNLKNLYIANNSSLRDLSALITLIKSPQSKLEFIIVPKVHYQTINREALSARKNLKVEIAY